MGAAPDIWSLGMSDPMKQYELLRMANRKARQHNRVEDRENGGVGADRERESEDRDGGETWGLPQYSERETQILR